MNLPPNIPDDDDRGRQQQDDDDRARHEADQLLGNDPAYLPWVESTKGYDYETVGREVLAQSQEINEQRMLAMAGFQDWQRLRSIGES